MSALDKIEQKSKRLIGSGDLRVTYSYPWVREFAAEILAAVAEARQEVEDDLAHLPSENVRFESDRYRAALERIRGWALAHKCGLLRDDNATYIAEIAERALAGDEPTPRLTYHADTGGNDAWSAECSKCYRSSGEVFGTREQAAEWRCPGRFCGSGDEPAGEQLREEVLRYRREAERLLRAKLRLVDAGEDAVGRSVLTLADYVLAFLDHAGDEAPPPETPA